MLKAAVDFAPAYELLMSLELYCGGQKIADLGGDWSAQVRSGLTPDLIARLDGLKEAEELSLLGLLVWQCPDRATVGSFIAWLAARSPGELYERLAPYVPDAMSAVLRNLGGVRDEWVGLLSDWDAQYFRTVSPSLLTALEAECGARQAQVSAADPAGFVEATTGGLQVEPLPGLELVLLVPQHHYRPSNYYQRLGAVLMIYYPADVADPADDGVPPGVIRLAKALGDENRLRILRYLSGETPRTFTEVQKFAGLSKNTVHHHLITLRAAGLLRVHLAGSDCGDVRYTARRTAVEALGARVLNYIDER